MLKSLRHYRKRLLSLSQSPELQNSAAMFASVLNQEARKTVPKIDQAIVRVCRMLESDEPGPLKDDARFLEKALSCYESDIQKAQDTGDAYFLSLVGDLADAKGDLGPIRDAKYRIMRDA